MRKSTKSFKAFAPNNIYMKYITNVMKSVDNDASRCGFKLTELAKAQPIQQLVGAFTWGKTPEGWLYWSKVDDLYRKYLDACRVYDESLESIQVLSKKIEPVGTLD